MRIVCQVSWALAIFALLPGGPAPASPLQGCDLVVERIDPDTVIAGMPFDLVVRVRNQGSAPAPSSDVGLRFGDSSTYWIQGLPPLPPGDYWDAPWEFDDGVSAGTYPLVASVDLLYVVNETDETNNVLYDSLEALSESAGGPDLAESASWHALDLTLPMNPWRSGGVLDVLFHLPSEGLVRLEAFDIRGGRVEELVNSRLHAGEHHVRWAAPGASGSRSGICFLRLSTPDGTIVRKFVILD